MSKAIYTIYTAIFEFYRYYLAVLVISCVIFHCRMQAFFHRPFPNSWEVSPPGPFATMSTRMNFLHAT